ncbi:hypothetical protein [Nonomuraea sp. NEAU-A123]|uniref:hypothetical protein n=1 Tax=Nonomuraea sp. NEAU-A123 TaxID=2839649 RepID=UPI001BE4DD23|nr:hypothetical protein [Nonomuraea sp. NEAU-A123]MBT2226905.1 hypothetical protein [Nonomuraea sp. NEAU-A123]
MLRNIAGTFEARVSFRRFPGRPPVEWCRPIPAEQAGEIGRRFPDLQVRADPAHQVGPF